MHFPTFRHEAFTRLLAADLVGPEVTAAAIGTLRDDIAEVLKAIDAAVEGARRCRIGSSTCCSGTSWRDGWPW